MPSHWRRSIKAHRVNSLTVMSSRSASAWISPAFGSGPAPRFDQIGPGAAGVSPDTVSTTDGASAAVDGPPNSLTKSAVLRSTSSSAVSSGSFKKSASGISATRSIDERSAATGSAGAGSGAAGSSVTETSAPSLRPDHGRPHRASGRRLDLLLARQSAHGANKLSDLASPGNRLGAVSAMLKGVPATLRRPRR
jgi:hypothetical protein